MNPLQQAWLKVLSPFSYFINERLAKRSGLLGKVGRFFMIGPREFGYHPINKSFIFFNRRYLYAQAIMLHRYSVIKGLTHNGYHVLRPFRTISFLGPMIVLIGLYRLVVWTPALRGYQPDNLDYVMKKVGNKLQLPLNTLNQRSSAHFHEISQLYLGEMMKKYHHIHGEIIEERSKVSDKEKKTRYADPSYQYEAMPYVHVPEIRVV